MTLVTSSLVSMGGSPVSGEAVVTMQMELTPGIWTDVTGDLYAKFPINWSRGIHGTGPLDLIARPGLMSFALQNGPSNSAKKFGYYSPGGPDARTGFRHGARVRLHIDAGGGSSWYVFHGKLKTITPTPGLTGQMATFCTAEDYLSELYDFDDLRLFLRENVRSDELITDILALMPTQPVRTNIDVGLDIYPFAFDDLGGIPPQAASVIQAIMQSERGFLYVRGDQVSGENFRMENRQFRTSATTSLTLTEGELIRDGGINVPSALERTFNDIETIVFPRRPDTAATTILVNLDNEVQVEPGAAEEIFVDYRDPDNQAEWVGGKDMVPMAPNTHWTANDTSGGGGTDLTSQFTVVAEYFGATCKITMTNNSSVTGFVRGPGSNIGLQCVGRGLYRYRPLSSRYPNETSIDVYGPRPLPSPLEMVYQNDSAIGFAVAQYLSQLYGNPIKTPVEVRPNTVVPGVLRKCIQRDIGDRIEVSEQLTGISDTRVFINAVSGTIRNGKTVSLSWVVAPSDQSTFFILDDPEAGRLDINRLGYV